MRHDQICLFIVCIGGIHEIPIIRAGQETLEHDNGKLTIDEIVHVMGLKKCASIIGLPGLLPRLEDVCIIARCD